MTKDEMNELSKIKPCKDGCTFCLSKCPKCGSVNIGVKYRRFYRIDEHEMQMTFDYSDALVFCFDCCPEIEDEGPLGWEEELDGDATIVKCVSSPELGKQLDRHFDAYEQYDLPPELKENISQQSIEYFADVYAYKNNERDRIHLNTEEPYCLNEANFKVFDDLPYDLSSLVKTSYVDLSCEEDREKPGDHYVLNTTHTSVKMEMIRS